MVENYASYLFVFAHPDDELYCLTLISRVASSGKKVLVYYLTSGDEGAEPEVRENESLGVLASAGIGNVDVVFARIPEKRLLSAEFVADLFSGNLLRNFEAVVSSAYQGGHEGHDMASFLAYMIANNLNAKYFQYPIYYGKPEKRTGAIFEHVLRSDYNLKLNSMEGSKKQEAMDQYASQVNHFNKLKVADGRYEQKLLSIETYRQVTKIDYLKRPSDTMGYEYHRNGYKFEDFIKVVHRYLSRLEHDGFAQ